MHARVLHMKQFFLQIFTWWNGQTVGTRFFTWRKGERVGSDSFGNVYYRADVKPLGERRWVIYPGVTDPSSVPAEWHGWLHHSVDVVPVDGDYTAREWQKPHLPNPTGTPQAHRPSGSILGHGERPRATGDYDAWSPK